MALFGGRGGAGKFGKYVQFRGGNPDSTRFGVGGGKGGLSFYVTRTGPAKTPTRCRNVFLVARGGGGNTPGGENTIKKNRQIGFGFDFQILPTLSGAGGGRIKIFDGPKKKTRPEGPTKTKRKKNKTGEGDGILNKTKRSPPPPGSGQREKGPRCPPGGVGRGRGGPCRLYREVTGDFARVFFRGGAGGVGLVVGAAGGPISNKDGEANHGEKNSRGCWRGLTVKGGGKKLKPVTTQGGRQHGARGNKDGVFVVKESWGGVREGIKRFVKVLSGAYWGGGP